MRVLLDILHPAHVHFFRNAIRELEERGHEVRIVARDKDITLALLDLFGLDYEVISRQARTGRGLGAELLRRDGRLLRIVRGWRPDVMASIAGISTARAGWLTRTRNLVFYDTENAVLSNLLSYPFATEVLTPDCYRRRVWGRHVPYPGYHELAYLHPSRFQADPSALTRAGIGAGERYSVVRFVAWTALHDVGKGGGLSLARKRELISVLQGHGRVFVTSEGELPADLAGLRSPVPAHRIHDLLAGASLYVGESSTMASESAILGTPAVYLDAIGTPYTDELEDRYGLCDNMRPSDFVRLLDTCRRVLSGDRKTDPAFRQGRERMLSDKIDVTGLIVSRLLGGTAA